MPMVSNWAAASRRVCKAVALLVASAACTRGASAAASALYFLVLRGVREVLLRHLALAGAEASTPERRSSQPIVGAASSESGGTVTAIMSHRLDERDEDHATGGVVLEHG